MEFPSRGHSIIHSRLHGIDCGTNSDNIPSCNSSDTHKELYVSLLMGNLFACVEKDSLETDMNVYFQPKQ